MIAGAVAGIVLSSITTNPTPNITCTGAIGSVACSSTGQNNNNNRTLVAKLTLQDAFGNVVTNSTGSAMRSNWSKTGDGTVTLSGSSVLSIVNGASETSAAFTLVRDNGNNKTVVMTATIHGASQTLTATMSSDTPPAVSNDAGLRQLSMNAGIRAAAAGRERGQPG